MKIKYFYLVAVICCVVYNDTISQTYSHLYYSYKIVFTKNIVQDDVMYGPDTYLFDSRDSISCLSCFNKRSRNPKISSNGSYIAYIYREDSLIIINTSNLHRDTVQLDIENYIWHPDGKQIIYQDYTGIKAFNVETKKTRTISANTGILPFSVSWDGKTILGQQMLLINGEYRYQMFLITETSTSIKTLDGPGAEKRFGSFSYDNKYLVYSGGEHQLDDNLYSYNLFIGSYQKLTESNGQDLEAVYSPDGQSICFVSTRLQDSSGNYKLYVMNSDGSDQKMIYEKFATNIRWPKGSEYIYFRGFDGIYRIKSNGNDLLKIVDEGEGYHLSDFDIAYLQDISSTTKDMEYSLQDFLLFQNYPNPFNPSTTITFDLPSRSFTTLKLFDALGREVATLVSEELSAGRYKRQWDAAHLASGIYLYRLISDNMSMTKRMILLK